MQKIITKVLGVGVIMSVLLTPVLFLQAEDRPRLDDRMMKIDERATNTIERMQKRDDRVEKIEGRIASSTASTTKMQRLEMMNKQLIKQKEQLGKLRQRLEIKEFKIIDLLDNISQRIGERITLIENRGIVLTDAKTSYAEANTKITEAKTKSDTLKNLLDSQNNATTTDDAAQTNIRTLHEEIKSLTKEAYALLQETIKNINQALPKNGLERKATSTDN
jgi:hypothetical protein